MATSWISALILTAAAAGAGAPKTAKKGLVRPYEGQAAGLPQGKLDQLVFARLKQSAIEPAHLCSDEVFLRRAFLDVIGTLPTPAEARQFLADRGPNKRQALVDRLLAETSSPTIGR